MEKLRTRTLAIPLGGRLAARDTVQQRTGNSRPAPNGPPPWRQVDKARSPVLLIAHSLGCLACAALPVPLRAKVAGALLVAPADERADAPDCLRGFAPIPGPRCPSRAWWWPATTIPIAAWSARACSRNTGAAAWSSPGAGHINADSGLGDWPQGLKLLGALRRRSSGVSPPPERISPVPVRPLSHQG